MDASANSMVAPVALGTRRIGPGADCFVIAEAGVNHNGSIERARQLVVAAAEAGADAVKFQTFSASRLTSRTAGKASYQKRTTDAKESQQEMLRKLELSDKDHRELNEFARSQRLVLLSSPFDETDAVFLCELGVPAIKIPSGEITNLPYLRFVAGLGKPLILSTGMSSLAEVAAAVGVIQGAPPPGLILLHCVSDYPAAPRDVNLRVLPALERALGVPVGFSDHTLGIEVPLAAVALGACVIEKHLTLDRDLPGPDHRASLEPGEFAEMVHGIRTVEQALGDGRKRATPTEIETARVVRKSLVAARDIAAGEVVEQDAITARRPGTGLAPSMAPFVVGLEATRPVRAGDVLSLDAFRRGPARDPGEQGGRSS